MSEQYISACSLDCPDVSPKIVEPMGEAKPDWEIFAQLAERMGLEGFPKGTSKMWLDKFLEPANEAGITLDLLKEKGFLKHPTAPQIAWKDLKFATPTGKYELFSKKALQDGFDPLPSYEEPMESVIATPELATEYPLHLISSHPKDFMHSQFYNLMDFDEGSTMPVVEIHPKIANENFIRDKEKVILESLRGELIGVARINESLRVDVVQVFEGWWIKEGGGINFLTPDIESDFGGGTSYYDSLCQVRKFFE